MKTTLYPIVFGDPSAMEAIASAIVGDEGHVVLDAKGSRLIVVTTPERHAQLNEVMGQADTTRGNVRIEVRFIEQRTERDQAAALHGEGHVVFGPGGVGGSIQLHPELRNTVTEQSDNAQQMLLVASGHEGVLRVGESVPYLAWIMDYGWQRGLMQEQVQWQEVGSFLVVKPTILADGETIHLRLTPELRGRASGGHPLATRFAALSTEVVVRNGETFQLGGQSADRAFYSRFLVGMNRSGVQSTLDIECTPSIMPIQTRGK